MEEKLNPNLSLEKRIEIVQNLIKNTNQRVVIYLSIDKNNNKMLNIKNRIFIIPNKYRLIDFIEKLKTKININSDTALYIYKDQILLKNTDTIFQIHQKYKNEDNALYLKLDLLPSFGTWIY